MLDLCGPSVFVGSICYFVACIVFVKHPFVPPVQVHIIVDVKVRSLCSLVTCYMSTLQTLSFSCTHTHTIFVSGYTVHFIVLFLFCRQLPWLYQRSNIKYIIYF